MTKLLDTWKFISSLAPLLNMITAKRKTVHVGSSVYFEDVCIHCQNTLKTSMNIFFQSDVWFTFKYQREETMGWKNRSEKIYGV